MIDGLEIVGEHPEAIGLWLEGTFQPVITRVCVRALHGVYLTRPATRSSAIATSTTIGARAVDGGAQPAPGEHRQLPYQLQCGRGIVVRASEIRNLQIAACDIEANMRADAPAAANILLDVTEGSIREGAITGCTLPARPRTGRGPTSASSAAARRSRRKSASSSIAANQISDTGVNIHLVRAGVSITGNTFFLGHQYNLLAEDCSQLVVGQPVRPQPRLPLGSRDGLVLADCRDATLSGLQVTAAAEPQGALIRAAAGGSTSPAASILDSDGCGILLEEAEGVRLSGLPGPRRPAVQRAADRRCGSPAVVEI